MQRTTVMLPNDLKIQAQRLAQRLGISFGELVRDALQSRLDANTGEVREEEDPLFHYAVFEDNGRSDLAAAHDDELYGAE